MFNYLVYLVEMNICIICCRYILYHQFKKIYIIVQKYYNKIQEMLSSVGIVFTCLICFVFNDSYLIFFACKMMNDFSNNEAHI